MLTIYIDVIRYFVHLSVVQQIFHTKGAMHQNRKLHRFIFSTFVEAFHVHILFIVLGVYSYGFEEWEF